MRKILFTFSKAGRRMLTVLMAAAAMTAAVPLCAYAESAPPVGAVSDAADGTRGHMYTGWHQIDGKWYYFHEISDGTRGHLLTNTTTPDGYQVGADGAWIPS